MPLELFFNKRLTGFVIVNINVTVSVLTSCFFPGHHKHCLHCRGESHGPGLLQYDVQSNAYDVPEPVPDQLLTDGRSGRLPHIQSVSLPLLLCGSTGGL